MGRQYQAHVCRVDLSTGVLFERGEADSQSACSRQQHYHPCQAWLRSHQCGTHSTKYSDWHERDYPPGGRAVTLPAYGPRSATHEIGDPSDETQDHCRYQHLASFSMTPAILSQAHAAEAV